MEFVQYILTPELSNSSIRGTYDRHWEPIVDLCHPCLIEYNVISKYETIAQDSRFVLRKIGAENITLEESQHAGKTRKLLLEAFSLLSDEMILKLSNIYKNDFEYFGYEKIESLEALKQAFS